MKLITIPKNVVDIVEPYEHPIIGGWLEVKSRDPRPGDWTRTQIKEGGIYWAQSPTGILIACLENQQYMILLF